MINRKAAFKQYYIHCKMNISKEKDNLQPVTLFIKNDTLYLILGRKLEDKRKYLSCQNIFHHLKVKTANSPGLSRTLCWGSFCYETSPTTKKTKTKKTYRHHDLFGKNKIFEISAK